MADSDHDLHVLLLADPGLPGRQMRAVADPLRERLDGVLDADVEVHTLERTVEIEPDHDFDLGMIGDITRDYGRIDVVLLISEIPRHSRRSPILAEVVAEGVGSERLAIVTSPALGVLRVRRRLVDVLVSCVRELVPDRVSATAPDDRWTWTTTRDEDGGSRRLTSSTTIGGIRLVLGLVRANQPLRTAPQLSTALAAASAAGAFGIFYSSMWQMTSYLSTPRMLGIGGAAIIGMVTWLIVSHRLWDRPRHEHIAAAVLMYNLSTVITLLFCVIVLYLVLVVFILLGSLVVIDPQLLEQEIGRQVTFGSYLDIAWLSAALGVAAGALGANFDSDTDIRRITQGQRLRQRVESDDEG